MNFTRYIAPIIAAALLVPVPAPAAQAVADAGAATPCSSMHGGHGVSVQSCSYALSPSPAGNPDYYVDVTISFTGASGAVRFKCMLGNGSSSVAQFGVLRASGASLHFVSPFSSTSTPLKSVACSVDAA